MPLPSPIHKYAARKLAELVNEIVKFSRCQFNTHKYITFLYTNNEKSERKIKETIPFTIATKIIRYLSITQPKEAKKYVLKKLYDTDERNQCSWIRIINVVKMTIRPITTYRFNTYHIKSPRKFFTELE